MLKTEYVYWIWEPNQFQLWLKQTYAHRTILLLHFNQRAFRGSQFAVKLISLDFFSLTELYYIYIYEYWNISCQYLCDNTWISFSVYRQSLFQFRAHSYFVYLKNVSWKFATLWKAFKTGKWIRAYKFINRIFHTW